MGLLENAVRENDMKRPIYWCHQYGYPPKSERTIKLLNDCGGLLVPITDFDMAMYMFGVKFKHDFSEDSLRKWYSQERVHKYICECNEIKDKLEKKQTRETLSDDENATLSSIEESLRSEIKNFEKQIEEKPNDARLHFYLGMNYTFIDENEEAVKNIKEAIRLDPKNAAYYRNRGVNYISLNRFEEACEDFAKAIELEQNNADYYNRRGVSYVRLRKYDKAVEDYEKAIKLKSKKARYYAWLVARNI